MDDRTGAQRTDRQVGWLISIGGAVYFAGQVPAAAGEAGEFAVWWVVGAALLATTVVGLAALGRVLPFPVLRACWIAVPLAGWALWLLVFAAYRGDSDGAGLAWVWMLQPLVASYPVLLVRPLGAVLLTVVSGCLPAASALLFLGRIPDAVLEATPIHVTNIAFVAIFVGIRARLDRLRVAEHQASEQERRAARAVAEARRQEQLGRLVHDEVLSVLTAARSFRGEPPPALRAEAAHTLLLLDLPAPADADRSLSDDDALQAITATLLRIDPRATVRTQARTAEIPARVVAEASFAAAEALRNSIRHAGWASAREIDVRILPGALEVVVRDDGQGFDLAAVDPGRLGVRESILGRMEALEGGDARIDSAPGRGTEVVIAWRM